MTFIMGDPRPTIDGAIEWAIRLRSEGAGLLGSIRSIHGLQLMVVGEFIWVRGESIDASTIRKIRSIPDVEWFAILADQQLTLLNETVPCAQLPNGEWQALDQWLELELPRAGFASPIGAGVMLGLVRSTSVSRSNLLRATWASWSHYALTAPRVRLNRLAFAVSDQASVLIWGVPLPPISGRQYFEQDGVIVPCGWRFGPNVKTELVRQILRLADDEMVLFSDDGTFERLPRSAFVQATRSAVRLTDG